MDTVSINFSDSKVFAGNESIAIRCGYLLANKVLMAGDNYIGVDIKNQYDKRRDSLSRQLNMLSLWNQKDKKEDMPSKQEFDEMILMLKQIQKVKYKTPEQIVAMKRIEKEIRKYYDQLANTMISIFEKTGLPQMRELVDQAVAFFIAPMSTNDRELQQEHDERMNSLSTVMLGRSDDVNPDDIYLVSEEFSRFLSEKKYEVQSLTENDNGEAVALSANLLKLPHILHLTGPELQLTRAQLFKATEGWQKSFDEWSTSLKKIPFTKTHFQEMKGYFKNNILPHLSTIQQAIETEERLAAIQQSAPHFEVVVKLFVCSVDTYWQFLSDAGVLKEDTLNVLKQEILYESIRKKSCLILEIHLINHERPEEKEAQEPGVVSARKIIS